jgi:DNA-binding XRE family transcriptional regulator
MKSKVRKSSFKRWIDDQLNQDAALRQQVDEALNEMRLEQDLIALREARGLSQSELAKRIGVSQPAVAKIESGQVKNLQLKTLVRTAVALGGRLKIEIQKPVVKTRRRAAAA